MTAKLKQTVKSDKNLSNDDRLMALLKTWHSIPTYEDNEFNNRLVWCLTHCQGKFRDIRTFDSRVWYFEKEQDAAMFALKWG